MLHTFYFNVIFIVPQYCILYKIFENSFLFNHTRRTPKRKSLCRCLKKNFCFVLKRQWGPFIWGLNEGRESTIQEQQMWSNSVQRLPATYRLYSSKRGETLRLYVYSSMMEEIPQGVFYWEYCMGHFI